MIPSNALEGGRVVLEVTVSPSGVVEEVVVLQGTPPFTEPTVAAVRRWTIPPSTLKDGSERVLVAAAYRPPSLIGDHVARARRVGSASPVVPVPQSMPLPEYPVNGIGDEVVVLAGQVAPTGNLASVQAVEGGGAFVELALSAARRWTFRPARSEDGPIAAPVFLIFGFRQPVVGPEAARLGGIPLGEEVQATPPDSTTLRCGTRWGLEPGPVPHLGNIPRSRAVVPAHQCGSVRPAV